MALLEGKTTAERNKTIAAVVLGLIALVFVARMLFGSDEPAPQSPRRTNSNSSANNTRANVPPPSALPGPTPFIPTEIVYQPASTDAPSSGRNIFAFYVAPTPPPKSLVVPSTPTPTPTPPPPLLLASVAPSNVYAKTSDFTMQVNGDKFTPQTRIYFNGQELPTRFVGPHQLTATVPASFIAAPGTAQVIARTPDNTLYSNAATLNIAQPPVPDYTFVGVLIRPRGNDMAMLKDRKGEVINAQRGDLVGGRFRVTSISQRSVELVDSQLKIKHTIAYSDLRPGGAPGVSARPTPQPSRADEDDDSEP